MNVQTKHRRGITALLMCLKVVHVHSFNSIAKEHFQTRVIPDDRLLNGQQRTSNQSSQFFKGWAPSQFPDPRVEPDECNIADVSISRSENADPHKHSYKTRQPGLLLCDPDHIFTPEGISKIANALESFTEKYAHQSDDEATGDSANNISIDKKDESDSKVDRKRIRFSHNSTEKSSRSETTPGPRIQPEIAVAIAEKMDLTDILKDFAFYTFEDEEDMISDAAMYFASSLHCVWFSELSDERDSAQKKERSSSHSANGILIFLSVADRICYISSGNGIAAVLPWWRLERVVSNIREDMRDGDFFDAILGAVADISRMLDEGPPTNSEKAEDFFGRFGIFLLFSSATFFLALGGEYRDRRKRFETADIESEMNYGERQKARKLQQSFQTLSCPICLEPFGGLKGTEDEDETQIQSESQNMIPRVDSFGIPLYGSDGEKLKILRCGHAFDTSCWKIWITSGSCTDPGLCPLCRENIATCRKVNVSDNEEASNSHQATANFSSNQEEESYGTFSNQSDSTNNREEYSTINAGWFIP